MHAGQLTNYLNP